MKEEGTSQKFQTLYQELHLQKKKKPKYTFEKKYIGFLECKEHLGIG